MHSQKSIAELTGVATWKGRYEIGYLTVYPIPHQSQYNHERHDFRLQTVLHY